MKLKLIILFSLMLLILAGTYFLSPVKTVQAEKLTILNGDLYSVSATLGQKKITNQANLKIVFDYDNEYALVGKSWEGDTAVNSESIGGTQLYLLNLKNKSEKKVSADLIRWALLDHKNKLIYFTDLKQDLFRFDINKNSTEKIMDKVLSPNLSPDGQFMVYQKLNPDWIAPYYDQALGLTVLDLKTKNETRITNKWEDWLPLWTPDGRKILFFSSNDQGTSSHFIIDNNGQNKTQLSNFDLSYIKDKGLPMPSEYPIWSPDGTSLIYESDRAIWINIFDTNKTKIASSRLLTYGKEPSWINNGQAINVILNDDKQAQAQSINVDLSGKIIK